MLLNSRGCVEQSGYLLLREGSVARTRNSAVNWLTKRNFSVGRRLLGDDEPLIYTLQLEMYDSDN